MIERCFSLLLLACTQILAFGGRIYLTSTTAVISATTDLPIHVVSAITIQLPPLLHDVLVGTPISFQLSQDLIVGGTIAKISKQNDDVFFWCGSMLQGTVSIVQFQYHSPLHNIQYI